MSNGVDTRMDYPKVEKMRSLCNEAAEELSQTIDVLKKIAHILREGGLKGDAGNVTVESIEKTFVGKLTQLQDKMYEIGNDIDRAIENQRAGKEISKSRFS